MGDTLTSTSTTALVLRQTTRIDTLVLDASLDETHTAEVDTTDHPVERGFDVTDHRRAKPLALTLRGIVSNTPLTHTQRTRQIQALGISFDVVTDQDVIIGQPGYAEQAYLTLMAIREAETLITITTGLRTYDNMIMTSLVVPRSAAMGDSLQFTAQFKSIRVVDNKLAAAKNTGTPGKKVTTGKQAPKKTPGATDDKSIAYQGREDAQKAFGAIKGFFAGAGGTP